MDNTPQKAGEVREFGLYSGQTVHQVLLQNNFGATTKILTWGAVIRDLRVPTKAGAMQPVVLGFDRFSDYPDHSPYFGAIVGRYANRIGRGGFTLDGRWHDLVINEGDATCLHGGPAGFSHRVWTIDAASAQSVTLSLVSEHGDMGFPGQVRATCRYTLTDDNALIVETSAVADRNTYVNLAQHSYFTLDASGNLNGHDLQVFASQITPFDGDGIPLGSIETVTGTALDYTVTRSLEANGTPDLDHNFVLNGEADENGLCDAARLSCVASGLELRVKTSKPGLQVYNASKMELDVLGAGGAHYSPRSAICLETQYFPDAPNQPWSASALVTPTRPYAHRTDYCFFAL